MKKQHNGNAFSRILAVFGRFWSRPAAGERAVFGFVAAVAVGLFSFLLSCVLCGEHVFVGIFHQGADTPFADFFSSVRDAAKGAAVYSERRVIYPPLANAVFWLFSRVMPGEYLDVPDASFAVYSAPLLCFFAFFALSLLLAGLVLASEPYGALRFPFAFFTLASFPVLFLLERGNLAVLLLVCLPLFVRGFYSESAVMREVGAFALGVATALKIYPVLFCLPLIRERRWRELCHMLGYAFLLFLIPSFFFGGPLFCATWLVKNTLYYSEYAARGVIAWLGAWGISPLLARLLLMGALLVLLLLLLLRALFGDQPYKTFAHVAAVLLSIPSVFSAYNWVLFLPALLAFFREERPSPRNLVWLFLMALPFCLYLPKPRQDNGLIVLMGVLMALSVIEILVWICVKKTRNGI